MKFPRNVASFKVISASLLCVSILSACGGGGSDGGSNNSLDIGYGTKAPDTVSIDLLGLMNYNGKTKEELFSLRSKSVNAHPELLKTPYAPSTSVFAIDSKNPWWGIKGYLFRNHGLNNTEGVSKESACFGNPYVLVSPEWYGNNMNPTRGRFPTDEDFARVFPTYLPPRSVKIFPKDKKEEVTYDVMSYYNSVKSLLDGNWPIAEIGFDLNTYNARDFGYNFMYVEPGTSTNINKYPPDLVSITQGIGTRTRETCAASCNDLVDTPDTLAGFKLKTLPAKCHLLLWRLKPASHLSPTDLTIDLVFN